LVDERKYSDFYFVSSCHVVKEMFKLRDLQKTGDIIRVSTKFVLLFSHFFCHFLFLLVRRQLMLARTIIERVV